MKGGFTIFNINKALSVKAGWGTMEWWEDSQGRSALTAHLSANILI